jgi:hypothetical protein
MTDGLNDRRPMKPVSGPVLTATLLFVEEMPHCETCERTYLDATQDEVFYRCEPEGLVRCCECLRREKWNV